jgi:regulator of sigma E protease
MMQYIPSFSTLGYLLLLAVGFGFVVFWHELGHFLAAKWAGVKVEQFAVGFGQAMLAWRKGLGLRVGTTRHEYLRRVYKHLGKAYDPKAETVDEATDKEIRQASEALGISETEYRLNWIPLGGYVKMLGQDDLKANADQDDPRAFNRKSIGKRMVIVSAGVVMNIILAAFGFMILFMIGFNVQPAKVGSITPNSPAQLADWKIGDEIHTFDGKRQYNDWTKITLNAALAGDGEHTPAQIKRVVDGTEVILDLPVTPRKGVGESRDFVGLGITSYPSLKGPDPKSIKNLAEAEAKLRDASLFLPEAATILPGDVITHVNGKEVSVSDFILLDAALQASDGRPVPITVRRRNGAVEQTQALPQFIPPAGETLVTFAGLTPRLRVERILEGASKAKDKLRPGDVILEIAGGPNNAITRLPTRAQLVARLNEGGVDKVTMKVLRDGKELAVPDIEAVNLPGGQRGLGVLLVADQAQAVVAANSDNSPAAAAGIPQGAKVLKVGDRAVSDWHEVLAAMKAIVGEKPAAGATVPLVVQDEAGVEHAKSLTLNADQALAINRNRYSHSNLNLAETIAPRIASGPWDAIKQGVVETRDFILQFYLTLRRMVTGDVSPKNLMGPIGIFQSGTFFAEKGNDWLIWFLAMISANLAVVNFLPIPIVDGGLFTFLLIEKLKGRPVSARTQAIAQYVGLASLLGVFLFVTYQDLANFSSRIR